MGTKESPLHNWKGPLLKILQQQYISYLEVWASSPPLSSLCFFFFFFGVTSNNMADYLHSPVLEHAVKSVLPYGSQLASREELEVNSTDPSNIHSITKRAALISIVARQPGKIWEPPGIHNRHPQRKEAEEAPGDPRDSNPLWQTQRNKPQQHDATQGTLRGLDYNSTHRKHQLRYSAQLRSCMPWLNRSICRACCGPSSAIFRTNRWPTCYSLTNNAYGTCHWSSAAASTKKGYPLALHALPLNLPKPQSSSLPC